MLVVVRYIDELLFCRMTCHRISEISKCEGTTARNAGMAEGNSIWTSYSFIEQVIKEPFLQSIEKHRTTAFLEQLRMTILATSVLLCKLRHDAWCASTSKLRLVGTEALSSYHLWSLCRYIHTSLPVLGVWYYRDIPYHAWFILCIWYPVNIGIWKMT